MDENHHLWRAIHYVILTWSISQKRTIQEVTRMGQGQSRAADPPLSKAVTSSRDGGDDQPLYPDPSGHEYDEIDKIQAELPNIIDEESRQQVEDYLQACDGGKGPMVACFATAEYISMFERRVSMYRHKDDLRAIASSYIGCLQRRQSTKMRLTCSKTFVIDH